MKKKRPFTLLEIMIAILLIGLIGSIVTYNMKGSLEEGKAFKTKQAQERLKDIIELEIARGATPAEVDANVKNYVEASGLVKKADQLLKDGWGQEFDIKVTEDDIKITSKKFDDYKNKKGNLRGFDEDER